MAEPRPAEVGWLTAFLDVTAEDHAATAAFWAAATGSTLSAPRGARGEFATLLPPSGDPHLRVQRLLDGPNGLHLDLHAREHEALAERLRGLGAEVLDRLDDVVVLRSPGGFGLCAVPLVEDTLSPPLEWGVHSSRLDQVSLDVPAALLAREAEFWAAVLQEQLEPSSRYPEFTDVRRARHLPLRLMLQEVGREGRVTAHADLATTDRTAEVARLEGLGATVVRPARHWTVLRDPSGTQFCVTDQQPVRP